ncbi:MAG: hypothetical protein AAB437_00860 [Patescibacteria group bacterium]
MNQQVPSQKTAQIMCGGEACNQVYVEIPMDNKYRPGLSAIATALRLEHIKETGHEEVISTEPDYVSAKVIPGFPGMSLIALAYSKVATS